MELKDRIRTAMEGAGLKKLELAKATKRSSGAVTQWLDGSTKNLRYETALAMEKATGYSAQWIATGIGDMLLGDSVHVKQNTPAAHVQQAQAAINNAVVTAECMQLCQMFASLPNDPFIKADVMGKISTMIQEARASPAHQENPETGAKQRAA